MLRTAFVATVLIASMVSLGTGHAFRQRAAPSDRPPIVYSRSNGGPGFSSRERIALRPDGTVDFETSGPIAFDWTTQNRVGQFETRVDAATYTALVAAFQRALPKGPAPDGFPPLTRVSRAFRWAPGEGTFLAKAAGDPSPIFDDLVARFGLTKR
jgi:hypothetical protein